MNQSYVLDHHIGELADICLHLCQKHHSSKARCKLPPAFTASAKNPEQAKLNLVVILQLWHQYECSKHKLNLKDMPALYNEMGGLPKIKAHQFRTFHNWLLQVHFVLRAALIHYIMNIGYSPEAAAQWVYNTLYENLAKHYVAKIDNAYRPMKYATYEFVLQWIYEECLQQQKKQKHGAYISQKSLELYACNGKIKHANDKMRTKIANMTQLAYDLDKNGMGKEADKVDQKLEDFLNTFRIFSGRG